MLGNLNNDDCAEIDLLTTFSSTTFENLNSTTLAVTIAFYTLTLLLTNYAPSYKCLEVSTLGILTGDL